MRILKASAVIAGLLLGAFGVGLAATQFDAASGGFLGSVVMHTLNGSNQGVPVSTTNPLPTASGSVTVTTLAVKTVTTGGTAVTAVAANGRTKGGWIQNPPSATINLCINEIGTATGTTSSGDTTCILPGYSYALAPSTAAVSVISSDSAHPFSGLGLN